MSVDIETRVRAANPLTRDEQIDQLFGDDVSLRLLRAIHDRREGRMTEQRQEEQPPTVAPDKPRAIRRLRSRINPAIAIAAFLVVIAVGIAVAVALMADEPDVVSPQSLAASYLEARDAHDAEAAFELLAPDAVVFDVNEGLDDLAGLFAWLDATDMRTVVGECAEVATGPSTTVTCSVTRHDAWSKALGIGPYHESADFTIEGGKIVQVTVPTSDEFEVVWFRMHGWLRPNDNYDWMKMFRAPGTSAKFDPVSIQLWEQATEEFVAEQTAQQ